MPEHVRLLCIAGNPQHASIRHCNAISGMTEGACVGQMGRFSFPAANRSSTVAAAPGTLCLPLPARMQTFARERKFIGAIFCEIGSATGQAGNAQANLTAARVVEPTHSFKQTLPKSEGRQQRRRGSAP
jgi:hypothetical protein